MRKGTVFAVAGFIAAGCIVYIAGKPGAAAAAARATDSPAEVAPPPQPVTLAAGKLFAAYHDNEVAADAAYRGRQLIVSGSIASISVDVAGMPVVGMSTSNEFMSVDAHGIDGGVAAKLHKGAAITMVCTGDGMRMGSPQLVDCAVAR